MARIIVKFFKIKLNLYKLLFLVTHTSKIIRVYIVKEDNKEEGVMYFCMCFPNGLIFVQQLIGHQTSDTYINLLQTFVVKAINLNMGQFANMVQDNCSIHVSKKVMEFFKSTKINLIDWPSRSPDLNIVENIWKMISDIVYIESQPKSYDDLKRRVTLAVTEINVEKQATIKNLYSTFRFRLTQVLLKKGSLIN